MSIIPDTPKLGKNLFGFVMSKFGEKYLGVRNAYRKGYVC